MKKNFRRWSGAFDARSARFGSRSCTELHRSESTMVQDWVMGAIGGCLARVVREQALACAFARRAWRRRMNGRAARNDLQDEASRRVIRGIVGRACLWCLFGQLPATVGGSDRRERTRHPSMDAGDDAYDATSPPAQGFGVCLSGGRVDPAEYAGCGRRARPTTGLSTTDKPRPLRTRCWLR